MILLILKLVYSDCVLVCVCVCVCVCGSGIPYVMGDRDGNIQICPVGTFFFAPLRKQAYKSYRIKFCENLKCTSFL